MTRIIDNTGKSLSSALNEEFAEMDVIAIASAYFNVHGYGALKDALGDKPLFFLLGREPTESIKWEEEILKELENSEDDASYFNLLKEAISYFEDEKRQVRTITGRFFHGKCYLGVHPDLTNVKRGVAVVGSSNFTLGGLIRNKELNMVATDREAVTELAEWFKNQWAEAEDFKLQFLSFLKNYITTRTPYEVVAKALYETYKDRIELSNIGVRIISNLHRHQALSAKVAMDILEHYGGVLIADSTGLGKSRVALTLALDAMRKGKSMLLIAPKSVLETTWRDEMKATKIRIDTLSTEKISMDPESAFADYQDANFIIIDEAHYFRHPSTNRYKALRDLIVKNNANVVLATATPVNTSLMDLYFLISLFAKEDSISDIYDGTLKGYFTANQKRWLQNQPVDMDQVLRRFMVRHSRQLAIALDREGKLKFPERVLDMDPGNKYSLDIDYQNIDKMFEGMNFIYYDFSIDKFASELRMPNGQRVEDLAKDKQKRDNLKALVKLIVRINLFKRLESSIEAFRASLISLRDYIERAMRYARETGYFVPPALKEEPLFDFDEELPTPEDLFQKPKYSRSLERCRLTDYEKETFIENCEGDIKIINLLLTKLPERDLKYDVLLQRLRKINIQRPNGIIVFSQYTTTASYLYSKLRYSDIKLPVRLVTGEDQYCLDEEGKRQDKTTLVRQFTSEGGILVSTDVLSEGQNLQNAQYVVNYDFPWNPVVLIQRVGRIDRLGSPHEKVYLINIMPKNGDPNDPSTLEYFIGLMQKIYQRLEAIRSTIGLDATTLGEEAAPKDFSAQEEIAKGNKQILDTISKQLEQFTSDPLEILANIMSERGEDWIKSIPNGIGAIKKGDRNTLFALFTDGKNHYWRMKYLDSNTVTTSENEIISYLLTGDTETKGEAIDYSTLITQLKELKEELRKELEKRARRETTITGTPLKASGEISEIYDSLEEFDPELAARFRENANNSILVGALKKAMREGKLRERAEELLKNISSQIDKDKEPPPELHRVCWCLVQRAI